MTAMAGHLRKGQNTCYLTGRARRRHEARAQARTEQRPGRHVIGHMDRAIVAASRGGWLFAGDYLATLGVDSSYAAAFGNAVRKAYEQNHDGAKPDRGGWSIVNGRMRATYRYTNELDLIVGALAYARTRDLVLAHVAVPNHPMAHAYAGV